MTNHQLNIIKKYFSTQPVLKTFFLFSFMSFYTCKNENSKEKIAKKEEIVLSQKHQKNMIWCDLDGDEKAEKVEIVINQKNGKSGLRITFGNNTKIDYFGLGKEVLKQGFDEFDWVQIFKKATKGETYWNNVNEDGEIKTEEEYTEADKLVLKNDGIFMHRLEECGGGIIYLENGVYQWLQQE